jgi:hypothetical protein
MKNLRAITTQRNYTEAHVWDGFPQNILEVTVMTMERSVMAYQIILTRTTSSITRRKNKEDNDN